MSSAGPRHRRHHHQAGRRGSRQAPGRPDQAKEPALTQVPPYRVLINDEEQHSIVPASFPAPAGWYEAGFSGEAAACEHWVDEHWPDIRPRSVREALDQR